MWHHASCGWSGTEQDIKLEYWNGFVCAASCPKCGGDWPWIFDDGIELEDTDNEPEWQPTNRERSQAARTKRVKMWS